IGGSLFVNRLRGQGGHAHAHDHHHPDHEHDHHHDHNHHHGPHRHTLIPPHPHTLPEGRPVNLRNLLALGISGGLVPCPSALVVMLAAIALDRVAFGLVLIVAFSLGLAGVLTGTGLLLVYAGRLFQHLSVSSRLVRLVSAGSALVMTVIGVAVTAQSLIQLKP
ncbi:MAG: sulfite exporter TauE/SafE family protein, partial [Anaerolineales bacterium]